MTTATITSPTMYSYRAYANRLNSYACAILSDGIQVALAGGFDTLQEADAYGYSRVQEIDACATIARRIPWRTQRLS